MQVDSYNMFLFIYLWTNFSPLYTYIHVHLQACTKSFIPESFWVTTVGNDMGYSTQDSEELNLFLLICTMFYTEPAIQNKLLLS